MDSVIVPVDNNEAYEIVFRDSFDDLGSMLFDITGDVKVMVITDSNVEKLYLKEVINALSDSFFVVKSFVFKAGEENKNLNTVNQVYDALIANEFNRSDVIVALGGGVTGDLAGFAAATYMRGIRFIQVPTTLLAQVDSSVGGKTGVDFKGYKNMVGAFLMPKLVYMNVKTLDTLDDRQIKAGLGEVLKYGLIRDREFYFYLQKNATKVNEYDFRQHIIRRSCEIKRDIVAEDPKETGIRGLLNFGHTLGHSIEKLMGFKLLHGECVAIGMVMAVKICLDKELITKGEFLDIISTFRLYNLMVNVSGLDANKVAMETKHDKKAIGNGVKFILLKGIGEAYIDISVTFAEMEKACSYVMEEIGIETKSN